MNNSVGVSGNKLTNGSRIPLYDNIKLFAILLVVIGHAINFLTSGVNGNYLEKRLFLAIYSVHMPLFIFISGLFMKPMDKSTKFPKQKVLYYVFICIVLQVFYAVFRLILGYEPEYAVFAMYSSFIWYIGAMAIMITLMWIFRGLNSKILLLISVAVGCMAGYDEFLGDEFALMRIAVFFPFLLAGYMTDPEKLALFVSKKWLKIVSVIIVVGVIAFLFIDENAIYLRPIFTARNHFTVLGEYWKYGALVRLACYFISSVFGFALICLIPNRRFGTITNIGTKTLQIYFWHKFFLVLFERFEIYGYISSVTGETLATAIYILLSVAVTFVCALPVFSFPTKQLLNFVKTDTNIKS